MKPGSTGTRLAVPCRRAILTALFLLVSACATLPEEKELKFSGFLHDYSGFRPGPDGSGAWAYIKPGLDLRPYNKILIDPLVIWYSPDAEYKGINTAEMWQLALAFQEAMVKALESGYTIVNAPGPGVIRIRAAMTGVTTERPSLESPGPIVPLAGDLVLLGAEGYLAAPQLFVGQASIEAELLDAQTHERLVGYIDKRQSSKAYATDEAVTVAPILELYDYWARKLRQRLDERRGLREYQKEIQ